MLLRTSRELGALIRSRRRELSIDQATLAARIGVSRKWLVEIERGKPSANLGLVLRALEALDLALDVSPRAGSGETRKPPLRRTPRDGHAAPDIDAIVDRARRKKA